MSTLTLRNDAVLNRKMKKSLMERVMDYFTENRNSIAMGMCAVTGQMPDAQTLREMRTL